MWALSEAALGGLLHALRVPLTGLFIGSSAVIFISLIGYYSESRKEIVRAMMIVLFVKAAVSPFTPPMAYLAVFLQGGIGSVLFFSKRAFRFSAILFGIIVLLLSSLQKILFFTLIYGNNLWRSIDAFGEFITENIPVIGMVSSMSLWIIGVYIVVHIYAGLMAGLIAGGLPGRIREVEISVNMSELKKYENTVKSRKRPGRRKLWITSFSGILIFALAISIIILTYIYPHFSESVAINALIMLIRSVLIMGIWFFMISPYLMKLFRKFSGNRKNRYADDIEFVLQKLPLHRSIVSYSWKISKRKFLPARVMSFIVNTFTFILMVDGERE